MLDLVYLNIVYIEFSALIKLNPKEKNVKYLKVNPPKGKYFVVVAQRSVYPS